MMIQSDLRFLLPIQAEQKIIILGYYPDLAEAISSASCTTIQIITPKNPPQVRPESAQTYRALIDARHGRLPFATASADHIIAPIAHEHKSIAAIVAEISRILRPGGWFLCGIHQTNKLNWLSSSANAVQTLLRHPEFNQATLYGAYPGLHRPRYMIPLTSSGPALHFFQRLFVPRSPQGLHAQRLAVLLVRFGLQRILFNDLGFVAQRI